MRKKAPFALLLAMTYTVSFLNADGFTEVDYPSENETPLIAINETTTLEQDNSLDQEMLVEQESFFEESKLIAGKGIFPEEPSGSSSATGGYLPKAEFGTDSSDVQPGGPNIPSTPQPANPNTQKGEFPDTSSDTQSSSGFPTPPPQMNGSQNGNTPSQMGGSQNGPPNGNGNTPTQ